MLAINRIYYIKEKPVVFLGISDVKGIGFFREATNPDTFFSYLIYKVRKKPKINYVTRATTNQDS
jgi:hypothetical protein